MCEHVYLLGLVSRTPPVTTVPFQTGCCGAGDPGAVQMLSRSARSTWLLRQISMGREPPEQ